MEKEFSCVTINMKELTYGSIFFSLLLFPASFVAFDYVNGLHGLKEIITAGFILRIMSYVVFGMVIHEFIHAVGFVIAGARTKNIHFGVLNWYALYTHCDKEVSRNGYLFSLILPLLSLGIIPLLLAFTTNSFPMFLWSIIMIRLSIGDIMLGYRALGVSADLDILDLRELVGFKIIDSVVKN